MNFVRFENGMKIICCPECNGDGWVEYTVLGSSWPWERDTCETCGGDGEIEEEDCHD